VDRMVVRSKGSHIFSGDTMKNENLEEVIVTVSDDYLGKVDSVAESLKEAGLQISAVLPSVGIVNGKVVASLLGKLQLVPGVKAVEPDGEMRAI
jgi:hypothetical protein